MSQTACNKVGHRVLSHDSYMAQKLSPVNASLGLEVKRTEMLSE